MTLAALLAHHLRYSACSPCSCCPCYSILPSILPLVPSPSSPVQANTGAGSRSRHGMDSSPGGATLHSGGSVAPSRIPTTSIPITTTPDPNLCFHWGRVVGDSGQLLALSLSSCLSPFPVLCVSLALTLSVCCDVLSQAMPPQYSHYISCMSCQARFRIRGLLGSGSCVCCSMCHGSEHDHHPSKF